TSAGSSRAGVSPRTWTCRTSTTTPLTRAISTTTISASAAFREDFRSFRLWACEENSDELSCGTARGGWCGARARIRVRSGARENQRAARSARARGAERHALCGPRAGRRVPHALGGCERGRPARHGTFLDRRLRQPARRPLLRLLRPVARG